MSQVGRQGRQSSPEIHLLLVPQQQSEHREGVTEIVQAERSAAALARDVGAREHLVEGARRARCASTGGRTRSKRTARPCVREPRWRSIVVRQRSSRAATSDATGNETRLAELGVAHAQHGAHEVDVGDGEAEHLAGPQAGEVQQYQGGTQDRVADGDHGLVTRCSHAARNRWPSSCDITRATNVRR